MAKTDMRIDVFFDAFPHPAKPNLETQMLEWRRQGHELRVFSLGAISGGTSAFPVTFVSQLRHHIAYLSLLTLWRFMTRWRRSLRVVAAGRGMRDKIRLLARDAQLPSDPPDAHFVHNLTAAAHFYFLKNVLSAVPFAVYYHGGEIPGTPQISPEMSALALRSADVVFSNTQASINEAIERGATPVRVASAPTSFPLERYPAPDGRSHLPNGLWRFVCVGRMAPEKGFDVALEAFAALRRRNTSFEVTMIGDGPELQPLKELANQLQLQGTVRFLGHLDSRYLIARLPDFDALVLSSRPVGGSNWVETQAAVMQEAMLMRTIVVASDIGGVRESLPLVLHPYLYTPGSCDELVSRLESVMANDESSLRSLGEISRRFVVENYDIRKVNEVLLARVTALTRDVAGSQIPAGAALQTVRRR